MEAKRNNPALQVVQGKRTVARKTDLRRIGSPARVSPALREQTFDAFAETGDYESIAARYENTAQNVLALSLHETIRQMRDIQRRMGINGEAFGFRGRRIREAA